MFAAHQLLPEWLAPASFWPGSSQRGLGSVVEQIQEVTVELKSQPDAKLSELASSLAARMAHTEAPNRENLTSAFAMMSEAICRVHGFELYHVQIAAGLLLADGRVVEMQTGEGKTLSAALPALLYGLARRGVHVVTPNSYLAQRDFELLAPVYRLLGCTSGLLRERAPAGEKAAAYSCDITYGTG